MTRTQIGTRRGRPYGKSSVTNGGAALAGVDLCAIHGAPGKVGEIDAKAPLLKKPAREEAYILPEGGRLCPHGAGCKALCFNREISQVRSAELLELRAEITVTTFSTDAAQGLKFATVAAKTKTIGGLPLPVCGHLPVEL